MSAVDDAAARAERATERLNKFLDFKVRREMRAYADEAAAQEKQRRDQARERAEYRRKHQENYDAAFSLFGERTPEPAADEAPGTYRRRLFRALQRKLPDCHDLGDLDPWELSTSVIEKFEQDLIDAAMSEAEQPSGTNLPADGSLAERSRTDSKTGRRETRFYGRESFIKSMSRPGRRVVAILGSDGVAIWPPYARAKGYAKQGIFRDF
jgi:hypothetical protein